MLEFVFKATQEALSYTWHMLNVEVGYLTWARRAFCGCRVWVKLGKNVLMPWTHQRNKAR